MLHTLATLCFHAVFVVGVNMLAFSSSHGQNASRPNIVLIYADDKYLEATGTLSQLRKLHVKRAFSELLAVSTCTGELWRIRDDTDELTTLNYTVYKLPSSIGILPRRYRSAVAAPEASASFASPE